MTVARIAQLFVLCLIMGPVAAQADLITFDQMEGKDYCGRENWLGDSVFEGCFVADHLSWVHTVDFGEPVSQINSATVRINFHDDDPDEYCTTFFEGTFAEYTICVPGLLEGAAITIGSASILPDFDFDYNDLSLDVTFGYEIAEIDSGWRSFGVPGYGNLINGGAVAVRIDGLSLGLQDFRVDGSSLTIDYTPIESVPEPGTLGLLGLGFLVLAAKRRHKA